jgi:regulator of sirC expression with transglutaminase-like and TPR domain
MSLSASLIRNFEELSHQSDDDFDMLQCALSASKIIQPSGKIDLYRSKIDILIKQLQSEYERLIQDTEGLSAKVQALQNVFSHQQCFYGDEEAFDDLDHLNMFSLLDHKCGTALSLSILFIHCAQTCGWSVHALNFPGYSLIRIEHMSERVILDPFNECVELDSAHLRQLLKVIAGAEAELKPHFTQQLAAKSLALRHLHAMKLHFLRCQQMEQALEILQALTTLEPQSAAFWREAGLLQARLNQISSAVASLEKALFLTSDPHTIRHTKSILEELKKDF